MAVTRLKRKGLRNKARAKQRKQRIKDLTKMPPINNVDVDAIKEEFAKKSGKPVSKPQAEEKSTDQSAKKQDTPKAAPADTKTSDQAPVVEESISENDTTAELREPAKGSPEDAEVAEEAVAEAAEEEDRPEVAPNVVTPEAGTPDEAPSEAEESSEEDKKV